MRRTTPFSHFNYHFSYVCLFLYSPHHDFLCLFCLLEISELKYAAESHAGRCWYTQLWIRTCRWRNSTDTLTRKMFEHMSFGRCWWKRTVAVLAKPRHVATPLFAMFVTFRLCYLIFICFFFISASTCHVPSDRVPPRVIERRNQSKTVFRG